MPVRFLAERGNGSSACTNRFDCVGIAPVIRVTLSVFRSRCISPLGVPIRMCTVMSRGPGIHMPRYG
jgi:hypothetical protein